MPKTKTHLPDSGSEHPAVVIPRDFFYCCRQVYAGKPESGCSL